MEQSVDEQPVAVTSKPRSALVAFLLSLLLPGLGQMYNGQPQKGAILFGLLVLIPLLLGITRFITSYYGLLSLLIAGVALYIYAIVDGVKHAKRKQVFTPKLYNTWYSLLLIAIVILTLSTLLEPVDILGVRSFVNQSNACSPTMHEGDWLIADTWAYRSREPDYGDIVVFSRPDGVAFLFRVVGRPNDTIELVDNVVKINGRMSKTTLVKETTDNGFQALELEEELPNGRVHLIRKLKVPHEHSYANTKSVVVPSYSYYVLGDNRDNAADSRYNGTVRRDRITGQVMYSYWGKAGTARMNVTFTDK